MTGVERALADVGEGFLVLLGVLVVVSVYAIYRLFKDINGGKG
jgi:hypothetical protein